MEFKERGVVVELNKNVKSGQCHSKLSGHNDGLDVMFSTVKIVIGVKA